MCGMQVSIMGLLANDPATVLDVLPWTPCNFNPNRFISGNNIFLAFSGPTEQVLSSNSHYIKLSHLHMKVLYLSFNLLASLIV